MISSQQFKKRFLTLIVLTWVVPPVLGLSFLVYIQMFSGSQMLDILTSPIEPVFCLAAILIALWYFNRYASPVYRYLEQPSENDADELLNCLKKFPFHYWSIFTIYLVLAPITVIYSAELFSDYHATPIDWFRINLVALIVSIIVGLPIFFLILDLFGELIGGISFEKAHVTIKLKVFLIGALVPLLIDTMLVQYYWTRTGYFTIETFIVWLSLELLAIVGSLIFVKSFSQSLMPLHKALENPTDIEQQTFQDMVPRSTDELGVLTTSYRRLLTSLKAQHDHLEDIVEQRTQELATSNKELESFCYSVSHDLRSPLRAINGFSQIILDDNQDNLSEESKKHLNRIIDNINKMSQLIEDLLMLSRVTSKEIRHEKVNLSLLVNESLSTLKEADPARQVDVNVEKDLETVGDEQLLKVALDNLIENSWKYTGKQVNPTIRFGYSGEKKAFFIADNGIGFDMRHAGKLFDVFQRLNNVDEFDGSGVGLTTVQRVIERHQGSIWAESEVGKGATFYFTV
ncbi:sensor histidine kinase [Kaarinaea lacus]